MVPSVTMRVKTRSLVIWDQLIPMQLKFSRSPFQFFITDLIDHLIFRMLSNSKQKMQPRLLPKEKKISKTD